MPHTLRTERLVLQPVSLRGARALWHEVRDFAVLRNTSLWPYPLSFAHTAFMVRNLRTGPGDDTRVFYIVCGGEIAGTIGLHQREGRVFAIGYMLGRRFWGRGIASEAVRAACAFGFRQMRASKIVAEVYTDNPLSARVVEKAGFRRRPGLGMGYSTARQQRQTITTWDLTRTEFRP